ncbi:MAG: endonuclease [Bacteroidales bacterium]|nr:endonuclease [Bacteroidales bacterium]
MKNVYLTIILIATVSLCSAQIPTGYYDGTSGKTGEELKMALNTIIKGHTKFSYTSSATDVWDILKVTDRDPNNSNNVILIYTGRSVNAAQEYNNGKGWTREHVWAKSRGDFGTAQGPGTDVHNLRPCDVSINSTRNNRWFAECDVPVYDDGVFTGSYKSDTEWLWEPRAEVKGDVARMIFYMATRYEGYDGEIDLEVIDYFPADDLTKEPVHALLSDLLAWHQADPVDNWEINRNNIIYTNYQHNRNPFIDHPEYVGYIWGGSTPPAGFKSPVTLTLVLDNYPAETSWNVKANSTGNFVTSGGNYTVKNATVTKTIPMANGEYTFNIADTYGDGICCSYGNGSYTLSDANGTQIATGGDFGSSDQVVFTIGTGGDPVVDTSMPEGYCTTKGNIISDEWIDFVNLGSINNSTGANGGYADFTSQSTTLNSSSQYTISYSTGFRGTAYNEYWKIWIDYNRDGDFGDAGEEIAASSSNSSGTLYANFTVPSGVSKGTARMRVSMKYNAYPTSCETFTYGEVEDYAVVLSANKSGTVLSDSEKIITMPSEEQVVNLYPNPATGYINLQLLQEMQASVDIININGQIVKSVQVTGFARIKIADLPTGMYVMKISDGKSISIKRFIKQ